MKKRIWYLLVILLFLNCRQNNLKTIKKHGQTENTIFVFTDLEHNSEAPFLFNNGTNIVLNWTEWDAHNKRNNLLKYAIFDTKTRKFDSIKTVPGSKGLQMHAESMAKVGIKPDGTLFAVYRKKSKDDKTRFGGHIYYVFSKDKGNTWSKQFKLVKDTVSTSQSFYDITVLPDNNMGLIWLDSRSKKRGKTLYVAKSDSLNRFSIQKPVAFSTCECCRTELYVDERGYINIAYRNLIEPDETGFDGYGQTEIRDMYYLVSKDSLRSFSVPEPISKDNWHIYGCPHTGPSLAYNGESLGAIWFTAAHNEPGLFFTTRRQNGFLSRQKISVEGRHPQMTAAKGNFYRVYEEYYEQNGKGYYKIVLNTLTKDGKITIKEISKPETNNNHAVITAFDNTLLIAWVNTDTRHPKIMYKLIKI